MFEEMVGSSAALQATLTNVIMVAPTDSTVMISGETGPERNSSHAPSTTFAERGPRRSWA